MLSWILLKWMQFDILYSSRNVPFDYKMTRSLKCLLIQNVAYLFLNWLIKRKLYHLSPLSQSLRNLLSLTIKWILNAAVNIQQSHYPSTINLQKHHHVLTVKHEKGKQGAYPSTFYECKCPKDQNLNYFRKLILTVIGKQTYHFLLTYEKHNFLYL